MDLDTLIRRLEELRVLFGGQSKVDVVMKCPLVETEEECGDVTFDPHDNRIKVLGKRV